MMWSTGLRVKWSTGLRVKIWSDFTDFVQKELKEQIKQV